MVSDSTSEHVIFWENMPPDPHRKGMLYMYTDIATCMAVCSKKVLKGVMAK